MAGTFALIGLLLIWKSKTAGFYLLGLSPAFLILRLVAINLLKPVFFVWMSLAMILNFVVTRLLLSLLFFLVLTPIGLIMRLTKGLKIDMTFPDDVQSYWFRRERKEFNKERYEKQY